MLQAARLMSSQALAPALFLHSLVLLFGEAWPLSCSHGFLCLQVPVLYQNQVVTWLDSKATFGSLDIHK